MCLNVNFEFQQWLHVPDFTLGCSAWPQAPGCHCCPGVRTCRYLPVCPAKIFLGCAKLLSWYLQEELDCIYITLLFRGKLLSLALFSPCFFSLFSLLAIQRLCGRGKADKHPSSCPGKGSGDRSGFPGEASVLDCHGGRVGNSGEEELG